MEEGKEVSWLPSYGPEMRGGTANCTVVISDEPVGSPIVERPRAAMVMNLPSLDKFEADGQAGRTAGHQQLADQPRRDARPTSR